MADNWNFDFFQIAQTGVEQPDVVTPGEEGSQMYRSFGVRMSSFGDLVYGVRGPSTTTSGVAAGTGDYTKTLTGNFKSAGELQNPVVPAFAQDAEWNDNPLVWGSTVKRIRNDEFTVMTLGSRRSQEADQPRMDVMDTKEADAAGFGAAPRIYPNEGWHYFGSRTGGNFGWRTPGSYA